MVGLAKSFERIVITSDEKKLIWLEGSSATNGPCPFLTPPKLQEACRSTCTTSHGIKQLEERMATLLHPPENLYLDAGDWEGIGLSL